MSNIVNQKWENVTTPCISIKSQRKDQALAWYEEFLLEIDLKIFKQEQDSSSRLHLYLCILTLVPQEFLRSTLQL
jgi:hypothetical protein